MPTAIAMPRLGMTMEEGIVVEWPVALGDAVARGDVVLIIESDKAEVDVESTGSGKLAHIYVEAGETVDCGTLLAALVGPDDADFEPEAYLDQYQQEQAASGPSPGVSKQKKAKRARSEIAPASLEPKLGRGGKAPVTPSARKLAKENGIDPQSVAGSGPGGRVTREDIEGAIARAENLVSVAEGVSLEVLKQGEGDRLLLLPGFGTDVSAFSAQIPLLTEHFEVWGVNPRGVGESNAATGDALEVATMAHDAAALIDEPAHIVGTSLGTAVAIELALTHPDKVRSLTLLAPLLRVSGRLESVSEVWCTLAAQAAPSLLASSLLPWFFGNTTLADAKQRARIARGLTTTLAQTDAESLARMRAGMLAWSRTRETDLGEITARTLVIVAGEDLLTPDGEEIAKAIPGARLAVFAGAGHAVGLEAPDEVNRAILAHLTESD